MDTSRIGVGGQIAGASGAALFLLMFLPWYGETARAKGLPGGLGNVPLSAQNGWESFGFIGALLLFLAAALGIGMAVAHGMGASPPGLITTGAGALAVLLIVVRIFYSPEEERLSAGLTVDSGPRIGIFLGLIAAAGITFGGWTAMNEERASSQVPLDRPRPQ